jgi:hypothetical protein
VPGEEQGYDLVAQLFVAHALSGLLVARFHEERQQVLLISPTAATLR